MHHVASPEEERQVPLEVFVEVVELLFIHRQRALDWRNNGCPQLLWYMKENEQFASQRWATDLVAGFVPGSDPADVEPREGVFEVLAGQGHEVFVGLVQSRGVGATQRPGTPAYRALIAQLYTEVLETPQSGLDGLSGRDWIKREAPNDGSEGMVVTRIGPARDGYSVGLRRG